MFFSLIGLLCIMMFAAGCTNASGTTPTTTTTTSAPGAVIATTTAVIPAATAATGPTWTGSWDSTFDGSGSRHGMILTQINETVLGTYAYHDGRISGTVQGNHLIGKWFEDDGVESNRNSGPIDWILSSDSKSFEGTWAYGEDGPEGMSDTPGIWTATRI